MTTTQKTQHADFKAAKEIAMNIQKGCYQRKGNYCGFKSNDGRMWVIGDSEADIQKPDATINNKPAREIFGDFTIMRK